MAFLWDCGWMICILDNSFRRLVLFNLFEWCLASNWGFVLVTDLVFPENSGTTVYFLDSQLQPHTH